MDELEISGRRYISSARAAKEHKYHSDYIGQLVRAGKVAGQKVGRAWYVDADSLAEYLGKEVPPRGPAVKKAHLSSEAVAEVSEERPLTSIVGSVTDLSSETSQARNSVESFDDNSAFVLPLRKSGRQHVIAAIEVMPAEKIIKKEVVPQVVEEPEEKQEEPEAQASEEETFIPLKISKEKVLDIYKEPEDSFYKVSRKGLRYVPQHVAYQELQQEKAAIARAPKSKSRTEGAGVKALGLVLVAGILSLGMGILLSYYLHSITTVQSAGQTAGVILSN